MPYLKPQKIGLPSPHTPISPHMSQATIDRIMKLRQDLSQHCTHTLLFHQVWPETTNPRQIARLNVHVHRRRTRGIRGAMPPLPTFYLSQWAWSGIGCLSCAGDTCRRTYVRGWGPRTRCTAARMTNGTCLIKHSRTIEPHKVKWHRAQIIMAASRDSTHVIDNKPHQPGVLPFQNENLVQHCCEAKFSAVLV